MKIKIYGKTVTFTLTKKEQEANTWLTMDDASLGKNVKATALMIQAKQGDPAIVLTAIGAMFCNMANTSKAESLVLNFDGVTYKGQEAGDFKVTVEKVK